MRITREEAITEFKAYMESDSYVDAPSNEACLLAVNALRSVHRPEFCNESSDMMDPPNEWVSVENAVPDPGERVLATDGTFVGEAYRTSANTWYRHTGFPWRDCLQSIVTLWMPLPTADKDNHVPAKAPNKPLTIEQLQEMKDEPAYLKVFDPLLKSGWHIIKAVTKDKIIFRGWQTVYVPIDGMGVNYNLYRRPPEGEEDTQ